MNVVYPFESRSNQEKALVTHRVILLTQDFEELGIHDTTVPMRMDACSPQMLHQLRQLGIPIFASTYSLSFWAVAHSMPLS